MLKAGESDLQVALQEDKIPNDRQMPYFILQGLQGLREIELLADESITQPPPWTEEDSILNTAFEGLTSPVTTEWLAERIEGKATFGLTRQRLLREYVAMRFSREYAEKGKLLQRSGQEYPGGAGKLQFFVYDAGGEYIARCFEAAAVALAEADGSEDPELEANNNPIYTYYRGTTSAIIRGVETNQLARQDAHTDGDRGTDARNLGGHVAASEFSIYPAMSYTTTHIPQAVGHATAFANRALNPDRSYARNNSKSPVTIATTGEASVRQPAMYDAVWQAVKDDQQYKQLYGDEHGLGMVFTVVNNFGGIGMGLSTNSIFNAESGEYDPSLPFRSFQAAGNFKLIDVSIDDIEGMAQATFEAMRYARSREGIVLLQVNNVPRVTDHTSTFEESKTFPLHEVEEHLSHDALPLYRKHLIERGVASAELLDQVDANAENHIDQMYTEILQLPPANPERLYNFVYPEEATFGLAKVTVSGEVAPGRYEHYSFNTERLIIPRDPTAEYVNPDTIKDGQLLSTSQHICIALAECLKRDPRLVVYGEDVGQFDIGRDMLKYGDDRITEAELTGDYSHQEIIYARRALRCWNEGKFDQVPPGIQSLLIDMLKGKGGYFGTSKYLEAIFGNRRVRHFPISEVGIVATATGRTFSKGPRELSPGEIPYVQIGFGPYIHSAAEQIHGSLLNTLWRSNGKFPVGMVIEVNDGARIGGPDGGVGGIGHGNSYLYEYVQRAGGVLLTSSNPIEAGGHVREAVALAARGYPVFLYHPISLMHSARQPYQGRVRTPVGEARVIQPPGFKPHALGREPIVCITHGNNVPLAVLAAEQLAKEGIDLTTIDTRGNMGRQFDYETVYKEIMRAGSVMTLEAGFGGDTAVYLKNLKPAFRYLDKEIETLHAMDIPFPAGRSYERAAVPQLDDIIQRARHMKAA